MATFTSSAAEVETPLTRKAALERILTTETAEAEWFSESFLKAVPLPQIRDIMSQIRGSMGKFEEVRGDGKDFLSVFEKGIVPTQISLDKEGRVIGLFFSPPRGRSKNIEEVVEGFEKLPGKVSLLVKEGDATKVEFNPSEPLAVGSAFKLVVLLALQDQIAAGKLSWHTVVSLENSAKSLPSGDLREWPEGSRLTLETLASLMISRSDNTATDQLMRVLGAETLEKYVDPRNRPFLTTAEIFKIKGTPKLREAYPAAADEKARRALLAEAGQMPLPPLEAIPAEPTALEAEWYFTAPQLAELILKVKDLPLMTIDPGIARRQDWERVAYKGGSEADVVCLVTWAKAKDGREITAVATWNNPAAAVDNKQFFSLYGDLLDKLRSTP